MAAAGIGSPCEASSVRMSSAWPAAGAFVTLAVCPVVDVRDVSWAPLPLGNQVRTFRMGGMPTLTTDGPVWTLDLGSDENRFSPGWLDVVEGSRRSRTRRSPWGWSSGQRQFFTNGLDLDWVMANPGDFFTYAARVQAMLSTVPHAAGPDDRGDQRARVRSRSDARARPRLPGHARGTGASGASRGGHPDSVHPRDVGTGSSRSSPQAATASMTTGRRFGEARPRHTASSTRSPTRPGGCRGRRRCPWPEGLTTLGTIKRRMYAATVDALAEVPS